MAKNKRNTANASGWRAALKRWRRNNRGRLNRALTRLMGTSEPRRRALAPGTRRILVVRLNRRLGNILFLTPMLRTLAASLPAATIDVVIKDARQKPLLETLPGIRHVWIQQTTLFRLVGLLRDIRRQRYDLAIDPSGNSASNRLAIALSGARQRLGFAARDQWLPLTHAAPRANSRHQAEQAVELLTEGVDELEFECFDTLAVFPDDKAQAAAREHWHAALGENPGSGPVIGFFAHATGSKQLPESWWQTWCETIRQHIPDATLFQIRPPGVAEPLLPGLAGVSVAELDVLAALLAHLDVFSAADSGPMHLAAAAGVPVVGLFRATAPEAYAPLGQACVSLAGASLTVEQAARTVARVLASQRRLGVA